MIAGILHIVYIRLLGRLCNSFTFKTFSVNPATISEFITMVFATQVGSHKQQQQHVLPATSIETLTEGDGSIVGMKLSYDIHGKGIAVLLSYDAPPEYDQRATSIPAQYLDRVDEAGWWSEGAEDFQGAVKRLDALDREIEKVVYDVSHDMFRDIVCVPRAAVSAEEGSSEDRRTSDEEKNSVAVPPPQTLHDYMYPKMFVLQLVSQNGELKVIRRDDACLPTQWPPNPEILVSEENAKLRLPTYTPSQLKFLKSFQFHPWVLVLSTPEGQTVCCKLSAGLSDSFSREYHALRKMREAGCTSESLHVPQLKGLVCTEGTNGTQGIVGILIDYIDTERYELTFHLAAAVPSVSSGKDGDAIHGKVKQGKDTGTNDPPYIQSSRREKWMAQIQATIHQLHALDIVWGDAKTSNILLDKNDDLWVVDFGGGVTKDWMDKELVGTKAGDLQAMKRILEEISGKRKVWRSDMRPPSIAQATEGFDRCDQGEDRSDGT